MVILLLLFSVLKIEILLLNKLASSGHLTSERKYLSRILSSKISSALRLPFCMFKLFKNVLYCHMYSLQ